MKKLIILCLFFSCTNKKIISINPIGASSLVLHNHAIIIDSRDKKGSYHSPINSISITKDEIKKSSPNWKKVMAHHSNKDIIFCCGDTEEFEDLRPYISNDIFVIETLSEWKAKGLGLTLVRQEAKR